MILEGKKSSCLNSITFFNTSKKNTILYSEEQIVSDINGKEVSNIHNFNLILNFIIFNV